jgi:hypothetical protein
MRGFRTRRFWVFRRKLALRDYTSPMPDKTELGPDVRRKGIECSPRGRGGLEARRLGKARPSRQYVLHRRPDLMLERWNV